MAGDLTVHEERMLRRAERLAQRPDNEDAIRSYLRILAAQTAPAGERAGAQAS